MARAFVWAEHLHLFTMLDTQWACTGCVAAMGDGRLPALAAVNGLGAPWVALHHSLLKVSNEEVELLALNQVGEAAGDQPQVPVANHQAEGGRADIEPK